VPDDFKVNPGAVEAIAVHHKDPDKVYLANQAELYFFKA